MDTLPSSRSPRMWCLLPATTYLTPGHPYRGSLAFIGKKSPFTLDVTSYANSNSPLTNFMQLRRLTTGMVLIVGRYQGDCNSVIPS
jgi:hypothetical protein